MEPVERNRDLGLAARNGCADIVLTLHQDPVNAFDIPEDIKRALVEKLDPGLAGRAERLRHAVDIFQTATSRVRAEVRRRGLGDDGL